ncbi:MULTISPECIES: MBL fold metallo-hydrolase [Streptomyces]|uniref:MBL fold metallo-hydrolase n=1 Tax=Streptomyces olivaceus TaxID=47716 RepID=A0ABS7WCS5_STROV|nr:MULTISPECIES: MBL fold metallo-hydrolase [Streptomyces]AOW85280.1 MBL fold metallo-hydrolase [Streptomyces olivaceus]MBZ6092913.1 MBL fold metallo-hydrolase [Streptomyces olivaceus]MBZ6100048.1 MBL fold metallo-hydrolase [Streptomyces olivaceus]MBZ6113977.1 MBL fold metallo-hydrolase [Streptomyces olivaceus]MBZ6120998.1 MBL fold metallo-hydrolase [Streptomyces olivaceus]
MKPTPPDGAAEILFIGNATLLIRYGDLTLLTDPNFLHRGQPAHLGYGLVSRRVTEPAVDVADLPHADLDAVVLSHLHGDHFDRVARRGLDRGLPFVTTPHGSRLLRGMYGFRRATGLRTWQRHTLRRGDSSVRVTSLPGRHAPGPARFLLPPVMGSLLEFGDRSGETRLIVYLSGDTLMYDGLREIAERFPDIHLAVLHLGGTTLPGGLVVTMDAEQGADLLDLLRPRRALPVHYDDYPVFRSPLQDFLDEADRRGHDARLVRCAPGERVTIGAGGAA